MGLDNTSMRVSSKSGGLSWTTRCSRTLRCRAAHYVRVPVLTNILVQFKH